MKPRAQAHLRCPIDRRPLELVTWEQSPATLPEGAARAAEQLGIPLAELSTEVQTGLLLNVRSRIAYPIVRGVPRMLTFESGVGTEFDAEFGSRLRREFPGYDLPRLPGMPGEADVIRTFSAEWLSYGWDGTAYWNKSLDTWISCMRFVLDLDAQPMAGALALEVGIGIGGVANHVTESGMREVVGMDLGYAVDAAQQTFGTNPFLHVVQGSVFAPPFARHTFDLVYSFGVIHHTFCTQLAFQHISQLPKVGGRLNVWVYNTRAERRSPLRRLMMGVESVVRPIGWRLGGPWQSALLAPFIPLYLGHQALKVARGEEGEVPYGLREAVHAARDRLTPRYAHRHSDGEVCAWFRSAGFEDLVVLSEREAPSYVPSAFTAATGVDGILRSTD